jgi:hypothetical protein
VDVRETYAGAGQAIQVRSLYVSRTVRTELSISDIIRVDQNNIRIAACSVSASYRNQRRYRSPKELASVHAVTVAHESSFYSSPPSGISKSCRLLSN